MDKRQLDTLYHQLRALSLTEDMPQKEAVMGITSHLTKSRGDYNGLVNFLSFYGDRYILPDVIELLRKHDKLIDFTRVVELGSGLGWLARGISNEYQHMQYLLVDKRQWMMTDIVTDIESVNGVQRVLDEMQPNDLVVMSELIHCLDNPVETLKPFKRWPKLVVEYYSNNKSYMTSYNAQITNKGCKIFTDIHQAFPGSTIIEELTGTYGIWLVLPRKEKDDKEESKKEGGEAERNVNT